MTTGEIVWHVSAWILAAIGLVIVIRALLWDWLSRVRKGRTPRCTRCWYDMRGVTPSPPGPPGPDSAYICPECGREHTSERKLRRARRRWGRAVLGALVLLAAWGVDSVPDVQKRGWWAVAPRPWLIAMMPAMKPAPFLRGSANGPVTAHEELGRRIFRPNGDIAPLWWPERWLLINRATSTLTANTADYRVQATAAKALVRLTDDGVERVPGVGRSRVVVAKMELAYDRLRTLRCRATTFGTGAPRDESQSLILLERPNRFRFEVLSAGPNEDVLSSRDVAWRENGMVKTWSGHTEGSPRMGVTGLSPMPIRGGGGVGEVVGVQTDWHLPGWLGGAPITAAPGTLRVRVGYGHPSVLCTLLLPELVKSSRFLGTMAGTISIDDATWEGRPCHRIDITSVGSAHTYTLWIDKETFLMLRYDDAGDVTTVFSPEPDVPLDASLFTFDPRNLGASPLQDAGPQPRPSDE